jgi:acyl-CoA dehydrogenase
VVERGDEGFTLGPKLPKLGSRCYPTAELFFADCFVPEDRRIGDEGQGFYGVMRSFDRSRVTLAAGSIGIGRAALEFAVEYAKQREAFGKKIHEFQAVSFRLVDAKMALDQARLMTLHAADLADEGEPFGTEASMAKLAASEAAWQAANAAVMTLGSYGYSRDYPVEKWLRDAKLEEIYEGTSDIQRLIIARSMFPRER